MKISDTFVLATRMFKNRFMRSFLTILGVSVGIGAVLFLVSLGYGVQKAILSKITTADSLLTLDVSDGGSGLVFLNEASVNEIKVLPEVKEMAPTSSVSGQISLEKYTGNGMVNVVTPNFFRLNGVTPIAGKISDSFGVDDIVISSAGVKLFNSDPFSIIGKQITLDLFMPNDPEKNPDDVKIVNRDTKYVVRAVVADDNTNYVYINKASVSDLTFGVYNNIKVRVQDEASLPGVRDKIIKLGFLVSSLSDTIAQAKKIFMVVQIILALFGLIALLVSAIGMFNTITISLLERTQEIGIMRAVGVRSANIRNIFLIESVIMGFLGGMGGIMCGTIGGIITNFGINLLAKNFGGQAVDIFYRPVWFMVLIVVFSSLVGLITGVYPSVRAAKINPLTALKYNS